LPAVITVLEITQAADVGMGSFYNYFETKEQLFDAALENHGPFGRQRRAATPVRRDVRSRM